MHTLYYAQINSHSTLAIIDIDGNNWSSRFGMLLCSNSIIIKVSAMLRTPAKCRALFIDVHS